MGFEPTTQLRDLVGCSNHWATGDWCMAGTASRGHTANWSLGAYELTNCSRS